MDKFNSLVYSQEQWHKNNHKLFKQSDLLKEDWKKLQDDGKRMVREKMLQTSHIQSSTTRHLSDRARSIHKLKGELTQQAQDLSAETRKLMEQKKRLENVLDTIKLQLMVVCESLDLRSQRKASDVVEDNVQQALRKEEATIYRVEKEIKKSQTDAKSQIKIMMDTKSTLEKDLSDKSEAYVIDTDCGHMESLSVKDIQPYIYGEGPGDGPSRWSTPDSWLQHTKENIARSRREQELSIRMRADIDNLLRDSARDMRLEADSVESALVLRVAETEEANYKLRNHIKQISEEIGKAEKLSSELKVAIAEHNGPIKVVQTRLTKRTQRPNLELCRDSAQTGLTEELSHLNATLKLLEEHLQQVEECIKKLHQNRKALLDEVEVKQNSLLIDKERCRPVRERYPPQRKLLGY